MNTFKQQSDINHQYQTLSQANNLLPIKVTKFYQAKIDEEVAHLKHHEGPLHRIIYPSLDKITLTTKGESSDIMQDRQNMLSNAKSSIIKKYADRIIFLPTNTCAAHCQYCFRQKILTAPSPTNALNEKLTTLVAYLNDHPEINEVILSGGDPMTLAHHELENVLLTLRQATNVENIRIHTRALSYSPEIFTADKLTLLHATETRLVFHIVHPYEICTTVKQTLEKINHAGIRCYNQFPLLRKINDHVKVLIKLLTQLDNLNVRNLSIFYPDAVNYSAAFRISFARLFKLIDEFNFHTPSWLNAVKFTLDTPIGKVQRENLVSLNTDKNTATFNRQGKIIEYPDLPAALDIPGDENILLWRE